MDGRQDGDANQDHWLLCVVVCSGSGLYVGSDKSCGDIFCMLHTYDGVIRSKTAVTGMVYNNHSPVWPSNGNGNAFVLPVKNSPRDTNLVITVWDGSESMEEANPVGKVEINLEACNSAPPLTDTELPDKADFSVDLVPRLSEFSQGDVKLSLMLERASASFTGPSARDNALANLLGRLQSSRKRERMERVQRWWGNYPQLHRGSSSAGDYSLVALLTKDVVPSPPPPSSLASQVEERGPGRGMENGIGGHQGSAEEEGGEEDGEEGRPIHGMLEKLSEAKLQSASRAPMRAQAELLARLKPIQFENGGIIMAAGTQPESIFFVRSGAVIVTVNGEEVSRIEKGQCLGEVGLLLGERRIADVKSCGRTELFELMEQDLWMALDMFPGLYKELHRVAEMRYEHVQSGREEWGSTSANIYTQEGPLREFQQFLQDVSAKIPWHSHKLKKKAGMEINAVNNAAGPLSTPFSPPSLRGVDINSLSLGSISETGDFLAGQGETKHEAASSAQTSNSDAASVSDQLSKRLEQFEQSGVFGIGGGKRGEDGEVLATGAIMIPKGRGSSSSHRGGMPISPDSRQPMPISPDGRCLTGSLSYRPVRGDLGAPVGSLEQARQKGNWLIGGNGSSSSQTSPSLLGNKGWGVNTEVDGESDNSQNTESGSDSPHQQSMSPAATTAVSSSLPMNILSKNLSTESLDSVTSRPSSGSLSQDFTRSSSVSGTGKKTARSSTRSTLFKIRFRKVHDCYTAEELGCSPRRMVSIKVGAVSVQCTKESDINAYFHVEGGGESSIAKSDTVRGDKNELRWGSGITIELEECQLVDSSKLKFNFYQSRKLWSDRTVGYSLVDVGDALQRPGVNIQHTYPLIKDRKTGADGTEDDSLRAGSTASGDTESSRASTQRGGEEGSNGTPKSGKKASPVEKKASLPRSNSFEKFFQWGSKTGSLSEDDDASKRQRGTLTLTMSTAEPVTLPFRLKVPPISRKSKLTNIVDHLGKTVCVLEYIGRSRCAWCTNVDPSEGFNFGFFESSHENGKGVSTEPCCNACSIKGWSECIVLWNVEKNTRLGTVWTDVTPRRHARARLCDHDNAHFASVRAAASTRPEISMGVRFKVVPTFQEIVVRTSGSMITGKSCSISHQVLERMSDTAQPQGGKSGHQVHKELKMVADITRVSNGQHSSVILYPGKDAARSLLLVVGINEASRLRPKAVHDGAAPRDKFDRDYEELSTEWQLNEEGLHMSDTESESDSSSSFSSTMMGMAGYTSH